MVEATVGCEVVRLCVMSGDVLTNVRSLLARSARDRNYGLSKINLNKLPILLAKYCADNSKILKIDHYSVALKATRNRKLKN